MLRPIEWEKMAKRRRREMGEKGTWEKIIEIKPVGFISQVPPQDHLVYVGHIYVKLDRPHSIILLEKFARRE